MTIKKVPRRELSKDFPTDHLPGAFWESLGRAVGSYGYLERTLGIAIFTFTATREYESSEALQKDYDLWWKQLEKALTDTLVPLIKDFERAVKDHPGSPSLNLDALIGDLNEAAGLRNILCHASWGPPDSTGASMPYFMRRDLSRVDWPATKHDLDNIRIKVASLSVAILEGVAQMGWPFSGLPDL